MAKATSKSESEKVSVLISKLDKDIIPSVELIRQVILRTDKEIGEQVKWNSPSFYYTGEMKPFDPKEYKRDIVVMNLRKGKIMLIFPTGARIKDAAGLLEGNYPDGRRMVTFTDIKDIKAKEKALVTVIKAWLKGIEK